MTVGLDPAWLADTLKTATRSPTKVDFIEFVGTGQMSRNVRFALEWTDGQGPSSIVIKIPSAEENTRAVSFAHGLYHKECEFYRSIAPLVDVAAPAALAVHFDEPAQDFAIVLEDLVGSEQGDQFTEPTDDQLVLAIEQAAALQAPVWGATDGPAFASYRVDVEDGIARLEGLLPLLLATVFERLGPGLDPEVTRLLESFEALAAPWVRLRSAATTLVHGDFRPDNFMFGAAPGTPPIMVVDWQTLGLGHGVTDIAYLLGAAIGPERRRNIEHDMLERYVTELARRGVDYAPEQCLDEYAIGSLHGVVVALTATTMADRTERGDALFTLMLNRHGRHALDAKVLDQIAASVETA